MNIRSICYQDRRVQRGWIRDHRARNYQSQNSNAGDLTLNPLLYLYHGMNEDCTLRSPTFDHSLAAKGSVGPDIEPRVMGPESRVVTQVVGDENVVVPVRVAQHPA